MKKISDKIVEILLKFGEQMFKSAGKIYKAKKNTELLKPKKERSNSNVPSILERTGKKNTSCNNPNTDN